jgi:hypothetical protein
MPYKSNKEINEEFDKKFDFDMCEECGSFKQGNTTNESIKSHITSIRLADIEAIEEWVRGEGFADTAQAGQFAIHADGYNQALEGILSHLSELKEKLNQ